jgi:putative ABC transport system permease protein
VLLTVVAGVIRAQTGVVLDVASMHPVLWICPLAMIALCALGGAVPAVKAYRTPVASTLAPVS